MIDSHADEKVRQFLGNVERFTGDDANHVERNAMALKRLHAADGCGMRPQALAGSTPRIMQPSRTIQAYANPELVRAKQRAPMIIDQCRIGLQTMLDAGRTRNDGGNLRKCAPIPL